MKTIRTKKDGDYYIATYTTLDLVTQGKTREKALLNLLEIIAVQIDSALKGEK